MDYSNNIYTNNYISQNDLLSRNDNIQSQNIQENEYSSYEKPISNTDERIMNTNKELENAILEIKKSIEDEKDDAIFYEILLSQATSMEDRRIIQSIIEDEKRHRNMLKEIYASLTKMNMPSSNMSRANSSSTDYLENLQKALFGELDAVKKYRKIMHVMPDDTKRSMLFDILTDELTHAHKYNFLITRNMHKM